MHGRSNFVSDICMCVCIKVSINLVLRLTEYLSVTMRARIVCVPNQLFETPYTH